MMHTRKMDSGVIFHFNGDFSGEVAIVAPNEESGDTTKTHTVWVPMADLRALVAQQIQDLRLREIEQLSDEALLGMEEKQ